jgi:hypothetical protein
MPEKPYKITESKQMSVHEPAVAYQTATDTLTPYSRSTPLLQPDEDLRRAITMEELRESALAFIDKLYAGK